MEDVPCTRNFIVIPFWKYIWSFPLPFLSRAAHKMLEKKWYNISWPKIKKHFETQDTLICLKRSKKVVRLGFIQATRSVTCNEDRIRTCLGYYYIQYINRHWFEIEFQLQKWLAFDSNYEILYDAWTYLKSTKNVRFLNHDVLKYEISCSCFPLFLL